MRFAVGIDVGGTFTDAVAVEAASGRVVAAFKLPSTRGDPGDAVLDALRRIGAEIDLADARVCHGTTVGTNALIERTGARTALVATAGFTDVIELRRQNRPELYRWSVRVSEPLVPPGLRFGAAGRVDHRGRVVEPLADPGPLLDGLASAAPEAVAVACLHAYANPAHERALRDAVRDALPGCFVTCSHEVCPELGEYERTSTTVVNAYVGPAVAGYLRRLERGARAMGVAALRIVKSNGGLTSPANAARFPVHLVESGPAAGGVAAAALARAAGPRDLVAFDMGGTTAKAGVVRDGAPDVAQGFLADRLADGRDIGGLAIRGTVVDIVEIGAGGGSVASVDAGGVLKVGPRSAGAEPGPACYGRGGREPTVTDAHAVIGTLAPETFAGTGVAFDRAPAAAALGERIAGPAGWPLARAAWAVVDIATARMAEMVRMVTVRRGLDPRDFALLASGGAGPLHAVAVAAEAGVRSVVVPPLPGMFSALGATMGEVRHDLTHSALGRLADMPEGLPGEGFAALEDRARALLGREPPAAGAPRLERGADLRFEGQLFELRVPAGAAGSPVPGPAELGRRFRAAYLREFGFDLPGAEVELVALRLAASLRADGPAWPAGPRAGGAAGPPEPVRRQRLLGRDGAEGEVAVYRTGPSCGEVAGPALVEHTGSTIWIDAGRTARLAPDGSVSVEI